MNRLKLNEPEKEIGLKLRLISAFWFALAASIPVIFFLLLFGRFGFVSGGIYGDVSAIWFYTGLPISSAALSGFIFGAEILNPWAIDTPVQAAKRGLKVSFLSYLIFISGLSATMGLSLGENSIISHLYATFIAILFLGLMGLLFVGWLVFIAGSLAGWALFHLSRLNCFEPALFESKRIEKKTLRKMILAAVIIFLAASVPATIIFRADSQKREAKQKIERNKSELIWATSDGKAEKLESLLANGADINIKDNIGQPLLVLAVQSKNVQVVELLLNHGADPNGRGDSIKTPLLWATSSDDLEMVKTLVAHGADVNLTRNEDYTPLMSAVMTENIEMAIFLLENGADINARNRHDGKTALSIVISKRSYIRSQNMGFANKNLTLSKIQESSSGDIIPFLISRGAVQ